MNERFENNFDFLRVFAALCIMYFHSFGLMGLGDREPLYLFTGGRTNFSFIGLGIFFSISGYLIAKSAMNAPTIINYLWKRILRIQPLLIVLCVFTVLLLGPAFSDLSGGKYFSQVRTWTYFRNIFPAFGIQFSLPGVFKSLPDGGVNGSLWTLIIEERLYIFMCILFLWRSNTSKFFLGLILLINLLYLTNRFIFDAQLIPYLASYPFFYYLLFLNSAALYLVKIKIPESPISTFITGLLLLITGITIRQLHFLTLYGIPLMVNGVAYIRGFLNRAGKWGDFTYGLYVFAFPIQNALIASYHITNPYFLFLMTLVIVFPIAVLSWHLVEKRFLRLRMLIK